MAKHLGDGGAQSLRADQFRRIRIDADVLEEQGAGLAVSLNGASCRRYRQRVFGMGMNDGMDVRPYAVDFGVNVDFAVARRRFG